MFVTPGSRAGRKRAPSSVGFATRTILTSNTNYYVSTVGSDSNPGTLALPWATLQHAADFISSLIDCAGFDVDINIGAGSFAGCGIKATVGGGILMFVGAGIGSTTITNGPNDGVYNGGECFSNYVTGVTCVVGVNKATLNATSAAGTVGMLSPGIYFYLGDPRHYAGRGSGATSLSLTGSGACIVGFGQSFLQTVSGNISFDGTASTQQVLWYMQSGVQVYDDAIWTITGTFVVSALGTVVLGDRGTGAFYTQNVSTYTGTVTGPKFKIVGGSGIAYNTAARLPGSLAGNTDSSSYILAQGVQSNVFAVANLPSALMTGSIGLVTDSTATIAAGLGNVVVGTTVGGTTTPVWADGTNWRIG